jgi:hypothetical protein
MDSWFNVPSGRIQVNIQLIMPNSSIVNGLARAAPSSSGRSAQTARATLATTWRSLSSTRA